MAFRNGIFDNPSERITAGGGTAVAAGNNVLSFFVPAGASVGNTYARFRLSTEPWALDALAFLGEMRFADAVRAAREREPLEPLVRGDELDLPPGPARGRCLARIAEERAAGTISTKEEALELVRRNAR